MRRYIELMTILSLTLFLASPKKSMAYDLGLGLASVEEGDDRHRPAVMGHYGFLEKYFVHGYYFGRQKGPVTERSLILSANRYINIFGQFGWEFLKGSFGVTYLYEYIEIKFAGDSKNSSTENAFNFGLNLGLHGFVPLSGPFFVGGTWESSLFLAGEAGILMTTGRKQSIAVFGGMHL